MWLVLPRRDPILYSVSSIVARCETIDRVMKERDKVFCLSFVTWKQSFYTDWDATTNVDGSGMVITAGNVLYPR